MASATTTTLGSFAADALMNLVINISKDRQAFKSNGPTGTQTYHMGLQLSMHTKLSKKDILKVAEAFVEEGGQVSKKSEDTQSIIAFLKGKAAYKDDTTPGTFGYLFLGAAGLELDVPEGELNMFCKSSPTTVAHYIDFAIKTARTEKKKITEATDLASKIKAHANSFSKLFKVQKSDENFEICKFVKKTFIEHLDDKYVNPTNLNFKENERFCITNVDLKRLIVQNFPGVDYPEQTVLNPQPRNNIE